MYVKLKKENVNEQDFFVLIILIILKRLPQSTQAILDPTYYINCNKDIRDVYGSTSIGKNKNESHQHPLIYHKLNKMECCASFS